MKKLIAGVFAATLMFGVTAPSASAYPSTVQTDAQVKVSKNVQAKKKTKVRINLGTKTNEGAVCTGQVYIQVTRLHPKPQRVVKEATKNVKDSNQFRFAYPKKGVYRTVVKYTRGGQDPCSFSRDKKVVKAS